MNYVEITIKRLYLYSFRQNTLIFALTTTVTSLLLDMSEFKTPFITPMILVGLNWTNIRDFNVVARSIVLHQLLLNLRKCAPNYQCFVYHLNDAAFAQTSKIVIRHAHLNNEPIAYAQKQVVYPYLLAQINAAIDETLSSCKLKQQFSQLVALDPEQNMVLNQSIEHASVFLDGESKVKLITTAIEQQQKYYHKECFYLNYAAKPRIYCMDYKGDVKVEVFANEQAHIIKNIFNLIYEIRFQVFAEISHSDYRKYLSNDQKVLDEMVSSFSESMFPSLYRILQNGMAQLLSISDLIIDVDRYAKTAVRDGILLFLTLQEFG